VCESGASRQKRQCGQNGAESHANLLRKERLKTSERGYGACGGHRLGVNGAAYVDEDCGTATVVRPAAACCRMRRAGCRALLRARAGADRGPIAVRLQVDLRGQQSWIRGAAAPSCEPAGDCVSLECRYFSGSGPLPGGPGHNLVAPSSVVQRADWDAYSADFQAVRGKPQALGAPCDRVHDPSARERVRRRARLVPSP
jgi:hypothetical protein